MKNSTVKKLFSGIILILILTLADQLVKYFIQANMSVGDTIPIIQDVFHITYIQNTGAAWGSFSGKTVFLLVFTSILLVLMIYAYIKLLVANKFKSLRIGLLFLISGACGNMIDRVARGYVIDMFDFTLIDFPVFNVADIYVTCSIIFLFILIIFVIDDKELEEVFKGRFRR